MIKIPTMDAGDGRVRAEHAYLKQPVAKTAAYQVTQADSGTIFSNKAASGSVTFTLPAPLPGMFFGFLKAVNNQNIVITAPTAATMNGLTNGVTLTDSTTEYGYVEVFSDGVQWYTRNSTGTWAVS